MQKLGTNMYVALFVISLLYKQKGRKLETEILIFFLLKGRIKEMHSIIDLKGTDLPLKTFYLKVEIFHDRLYSFLLMPIKY